MKTKKSPKPDPRLVAILRAYEAAELQATILFYAAEKEEDGYTAKLDRMSDMNDACRHIRSTIACGLAFPTLGNTLDRLAAGAEGYSARRTAWLRAVSQDVKDLVLHGAIRIVAGRRPLGMFPVSPPSEPPAIRAIRAAVDANDLPEMLQRAHEVLSHEDRCGSPLPEDLASAMAASPEHLDA